MHSSCIAGVTSDPRDAARGTPAHERFWNGYIDDLRKRLGDLTFRLDDDTMIVLKRFRVVERLDSDAVG